MSKETNEQKEFETFLAENGITAKDYAEITEVLEIEELEDYLSYRKVYNIKPDDYKRIRSKFNDLTDLPEGFDLDLYIRHQKDRSYQSNMFLMDSLTKVLKNVFVYTE